MTRNSSGLEKNIIFQGNNILFFIAFYLKLIQNILHFTESKPELEAELMSPTFIASQQGKFYWSHDNKNAELVVHLWDNTPFIHNCNSNMNKKKYVPNTF